MIQRDETTLLLNGDKIKIFSQRLATVIVSVIQKKKRYPGVLGGDCSILIGNMLALRKLRRFGLFLFMDMQIFINLLPQSPAKL
jgi:arginase